MEKQNKEQEMEVLQAEGVVSAGIINPEDLKGLEGKTAEEKLALVGIDVAGAVKKAKIETSIMEEASVLNHKTPEYVIEMLKEKHGMTEEQAKEYLDARTQEQSTQLEEAKERFIAELVEKEQCTSEEAELRFKQQYARQYMEPVDSFIYDQFVGLFTFYTKVNEAMDNLKMNRAKKHEEFLSIAKTFSFKTKELGEEYQKVVRLYLEDAWAAQGALAAHFASKQEQKESKEDGSDTKRNEEPTS